MYGYTQAARLGQNLTIVWKRKLDLQIFSKFTPSMEFMDRPKVKGRLGVSPKYVPTFGIWAD